MKKCSACGHENRNNAAFCANCGEEMEQSKSYKGYMIGGAAAVAVIAAAAIGIASGGNTEKDAEKMAAAEISETVMTDSSAASEEQTVTESSAAEETEAVPAEASAPQTPLTILYWNGSDIEPMVDYFCQSTAHSTSEFNIVDFHLGSTYAVDLYREYLSDPANDADIIFLNADWCKRFITDESEEYGAMPLSELGFTEDDFSDIYPYLVEIGKDGSGVQKAIACEAAPGAFCYREDLAEKYLNVTSPEEMQELVSDWDKFEETAGRIHDASNGETVIVPSVADVFKVFLSQRTIPFVIDNKVQFSDETKEMLEYCRRIHDKGYILHDVEQYSDAWYEAGRTDQAFGYFVPSWGFGNAILTKAAGGSGGATYGKWKAVKGPANYFEGDCWMEVANRSDNPELVKEFISFFTSDTDNVVGFAKNLDKFPANKSALNVLVETNKYKGAKVLHDQNQFIVLDDVADDISLNSVMTEYDLEVSAALTTVVLEYCRGHLNNIDEAQNRFLNDVVGDLPDLDYSDFF